MKGGRKRICNGLIFAVLFTLLAFVSVGCVSAATTYYVNPGDLIQTAVTAAGPGDTVIVRDGTYTENVEVNVANLTLRSENGSAFTTVLAALNSSDVFFVTANSVTIMGFTVRNATDSASGIHLHFVHHCTISGNNASGNYNGIRLISSSNNTLTGNTANLNYYDGIGLYISSNHNTIASNTAFNNEYGIDLSSSSNNSLTANTANSNNYDGIYLGYSSNNNNLTGNTANSNNDTGIYLYSSSNNNLMGNTATNNSNVGIYLEGADSNTISESEATENTFTGIYLHGSTHNNVTNSTANSNVYYGILLWSHSNNNTIQTNTASDNEYGITFGYSDSNTIYNNIVRDNSWVGVEMQQPSNNNTVSNNTIDNNGQYGILIGRCDSYYSWNRIIRNTITNNNYGLYAVNATNTTIEGNIIAKNSYGGIYLSESSTNNSINENIVCENGISDFYLEGSPVGNIGDENTCGLSDGWADEGTTGCTYFCAVNLAFDTGPGTYPSIAGTFNCTIRPNETITVDKLYTYPCPGTGGHTKFVKIWNSTDWNVTATWNGYTGDWHNLTFNQSFTLYANETYNYTIRTGSYPQIIHASSHNATGGIITCTEFVDLNGKRYEGWIPAIRLYWT